MVEVLFINISDQPSEELFNQLRDFSSKAEKWLSTNKNFDEVKEKSLQLGMAEKTLDNMTIFYDTRGFGYNIYTLVREA